MKSFNTAVANRQSPDASFDIAWAKASALVPLTTEEERRMRLFINEEKH